MIERVLLAKAASIIGVEQLDLLFAALAGEFIAEVVTPAGYLIIDHATLKGGLEYGTIVIGQFRAAPAPKGMSNYDAISTAHERSIEQPKFYQLGDLLFRTDELWQYLNLHDSKKAQLDFAKVIKIDERGNTVQFKGKTLKLKLNQVACVRVISERRKAFDAGDVPTSGMHQKKILEIANVEKNVIRLDQVFRTKEYEFKILFKRVTPGYYELNLRSPKNKSLKIKKRK